MADHIYVIAGKDESLVGTRYQELLDELLDPQQRMTALLALDGDEASISDVLDELETMEKKLVYFIDDNFFGVGKESERRALELCKGIVERNIRKIWVTQASINMADNPEMLYWAHKSGCRGVYVGVESVVPESLKEMRKGINLGLGVEGCKAAIRWPPAS